MGFLIEPHQDIVRIVVTHKHIPDKAMSSAISHGWAGILANLKSFLETGEVLPQTIYDMNNPFEWVDLLYPESTSP